MNVTNQNTSVVAVFDPNTELIEWRDIPGFTGYQASETGAIRRKTGYGFFYGKFSKWKTSKGTYISTSAISDCGRYRSKGVHVLVCLAFHGLPPSSELRYDVNHKNGNKHDCLPGNLEWMTRSQNLDHAHETGLRKESVAVILIDHDENIQTRYYSLGQLGKQFDLDAKQMTRVIERHKTKLWRERYTFELDLSNRKVTQFSWVSEIYAKDVFTGVTTIYSDSLAASLGTGIKRMTILKRVREKSIALAGKYVFTKTLEDLPPKGFYSKEAIAESMAEFEKRSLRQNRTTTL